MEEERKKKKDDDADKKKSKKEDDEEEDSGFWGWIILIGVVVLIAVFFLSKNGLTGITGDVISEDNVKVGVMIPLSGDAASYGLSVQKGIEMAVSDLGLDNYELIYEDSKCEGKDAITVINKLISVDKVHAIIGELCSGASLAAAPIAEENKVVLISPASTSPELSSAGGYIYRTVPSDALQGKFGARLVEDMGYEKLAILYGNEDYGLGFSNVLVEEFSGEIVANEPFERGSTDLRSQITKIKNSKADAIYIISNSPDSAVAALKQIKQLGVKAQIFGSEGLKSDNIISGAGNSADGVIITSVSSGSVPFFREHRRVYRESPGQFAPQGYDALQAISLAIKAGAKNREQIKEKLDELSFDGVSGRLDFDSNGDVSGNYEVYEVRGDVFVPLANYGVAPEITEELEILLEDLNVSL